MGHYMYIDNRCAYNCNSVCVHGEFPTSSIMMIIQVKLTVFECRCGLYLFRVEGTIPIFQVY